MPHIHAHASSFSLSLSLPLDEEHAVEKGTCIDRWTDTNASPPNTFLIPLAEGVVRCRLLLVLPTGPLPAQDVAAACAVEITRASVPL